MKWMFAFLNILFSVFLISSCTDSEDNDPPEVEGERLEVYLKEGMIQLYDMGVVYDSYDRYHNGTSLNSYYYSADIGINSDSGLSDIDLLVGADEYIHSMRKLGYSYGDLDSRRTHLLSYLVSEAPMASTLVSDIELPESSLGFGLYQNDDMLIAVVGSDNSADVAAVDEDAYLSSVKQRLQVYFYEAGSGQPSLQKTLGFDGSLLESKVVNDQLFLVLRYAPSSADIAGLNSARTKRGKFKAIANASMTDFLPSVWVDQKETATLFADGACNISDSENYGYWNLVSVVRIDLNNPDNWQAMCNSGRIDGVYFSENSLIFNSYGDNGHDVTRLDWYDLNEFALKATGFIPGRIEYPEVSALRMSEEDGVLRVLFQSYDFSAWDGLDAKDILNVVSENSVRLTDGDDLLVDDTQREYRLMILQPNVTSESSGLIDKVSELSFDFNSFVSFSRFYGDHIYIESTSADVSQPGPLYVINIEDPARPYIENNLALPLMSEYMHSIRSDLILAFDGSFGDFVDDRPLKVSLIDTSDPARPVEVQHLDLGDSGSYADVVYDKRAISYREIDDQTVRVAFSWILFEDDVAYHAPALAVLDIDLVNRTFTERLNETYLYESLQLFNARMILGDDGLHFSNNGRVTSGELESFTFD